MPQSDTTVYMVRHAESPFVFGEERIRPLSEKGLADAEAIAGINRNPVEGSECKKKRSDANQWRCWRVQ